ncbi:uncharacterized protein BO72DRAFT_424336 [Aspergillus fijiensis CBS 313.89]|uniref:CENP-V/GFA domain-containing protein n=1 Tax=Aspergillus fijiensis CBS 313.89 TaxID=1448319 RepID=A0A8G1RXI0_9EURO|nr:uncharacterized protein BO72DRAFT_424336 [Aspergillus fijiensis CBS 313.89]RAK79600.1 hypothetical protein BO72DRAFT_424336 [Aspergillus fijiensis CBS 313.89]
MTEAITHIVLFKYKPSITWSEFEEHFAVFLALKDKCKKPDTGRPYMKSMKAGKNRSWEPFSKGMTHGFVLEFENQADLDYYLTEDPVHLKFSKKAAPLIEDSVVIDIRDGVLFGPPAKKPTVGAGTFHGSCHCGDCSWTAEITEPEHILCHCETCRKLGGGPYSMNQIIHKDQLRILSGKPSTYTYTGASGNPVHCYFCPNCTSHIYHHQAVMGDQIIIRTILLDNGARMPPAGEIFAEGKLAWVDALRAELEKR